MSRKFFGKGVLMLACSVGLTCPSFAAGGTDAVATTNTTSTTSATTAPASSTSSSTTTQTTTTPATATPAASGSTTTTTTTTAAPAAAAPAGAASTTTSTATTTTTTDAPKAPVKKRDLGGYPSSWVTKKEAAPEDTTNYKQTYKNAVHSESVLIAEYVGYQKNPDVRFNQPILADYKIVKVLKGPPLNKRLPIKYEFHDHSNPPTPPGWKFNEKELMPAVGSQWLIFIEHAVPHNGQFETYEGSWGRQPATEDNLNQVYELLQNQGETGY